MDNGICKGEICNRDGCTGIIDEHDSDYSCSCHINPPCSYCTTDRTYCPECNYDGGEEQQIAEAERIAKSYKGFGSKQMHDDYYGRQAKQAEFNKKFNAMYAGSIPADKFTMIFEEHTHFTMIKRGVFPKGTETRESLLLNYRIEGTFGGRFESFTNHSFKYIAYTD